MDTLQTLRLELDGECLYAANTGRPFDGAGVVSVCAQHLSSKGSRGHRIQVPDVPDAALVETIRDLQVRLYTLDPNLLISDRNAEEETSKDYEGRCLLELLQNADDAMAPAGSRPAELIGAKGLGFKSTLEFSDTPQVFSEPFSFGFDQTCSRALLSDLDVGDDVGVFRIPHAVARDAVVERLLAAGYATVVRLPLRDSRARRSVEEGLAALQPHFLLLSQHIERVEISSGRSLRELSRQGARGTPGGADARIRVRAGSRTEHDSTWRVWRETWPAPSDTQKRASVAVAVQLADGRPVPAAASLPIHVFYPTEDQVSAEFLIHGSFDVAQNRQRIRTGENDAAILERLGEIVSRIAVAEPALDILKVFRRIVADAPKGRPSKLPRLVQHAVRKALLNASFVPVIGRGARRVQPSVARLSAPGFAGLLNAKARRVADAAVVRSELEAVHPVLLDLQSTPLATGD